MVKQGKGDMREITIYPGIPSGDFVTCNGCGETMVLPCGADQCPECCCDDGLEWVREDSQEVSWSLLQDKLTMWGFFSLRLSSKKLKPEDYLSPDTLASEFPDYYRELKMQNNLDLEEQESLECSSEP
jgi:hypothetical protein